MTKGRTQRLVINSSRAYSEMLLAYTYAYDVNDDMCINCYLFILVSNIFGVCKGRRFDAQHRLTLEQLHFVDAE